MGSFSIWHWLLVLAIIILVFGTKKLKSLGRDVGEAVKGFKDAVNEPTNKNSPITTNSEDNVNKKMDA